MRHLVAAVQAKPSSLNAVGFQIAGVIEEDSSRRATQHIEAEGLERLILERIGRKLHLPAARRRV